MVQKIQRNEPCPCGSGKKYKKCCMLKQRDQAAERASHREGVQQSLAWINRHYRNQINQWVEDVWLAGISADEREGIATADASIRSIHDVNLLEQLVAEGSFSEQSDENRPLQLILDAEELQLDEGQRSYLAQLAKRPLRLYRVVACDAGESFTLQDQLAEDGESFVIADRWASRMFDIGDTVGLRLMQTSDGAWETSGAIYHIPDEYVADLIPLLEQNGGDSYSLALIHYWLGLVAAHV